MVTLIFDTAGGLCNQFYDIVNGINFCLKHNIFFTFRHSAFRNKGLIGFTEEPFEKLFDLNFLNKYELYIKFDTIKEKLTNNNCYNLHDKKFAYQFLNNNNILEQLISLNKEYVVLKQFWASYKFRDFIDPNIHTCICPAKDIMEKYLEIKNTLIKDTSYNCIHYRYEHDFTKFFKVNVESLDKLLENIKFKNNNLNIYIATSNIKTLLDLNNSKYKNLLFKNDDMLQYLNFEQRAWIDYLFCLNSVEFYGHSKSSFSHMINNIKQTKNFYA